MDDIESKNMVECIGTDVRQLLISLDMRSKTKNKSIVTMKDTLNKGLFETTKSILNKTGTLDERCESFLHDYSMTPFFIQQNYTSHVFGLKNSMNSLYTTSMCVSDTDIISSKMHDDNQWDLLGIYSALNVRVGTVGYKRHRKTEFPRMLGNISKINKRISIISEMSKNIVKDSIFSPFYFRMNYIPLIWDSMFIPLSIGFNASDLDSYIYKMNEFRLTRDDVFESLCLFQLGKLEYLKNINSKVKSSITRLYNKKNKKRKI